MALPSGTSKLSFSGEEEVTDGSNSAVTNGSKSVQADLSGGAGWTNTGDAATASFKLVAAFASAPTVNTTIGLYARLMNVDGTNDEPIPDATFNGRFIGEFVLDAVTASTPYIEPDRVLPMWETGQVIEFYIKNNSGQTMSANWRLYVNPTGFGTVA